MRRRRPLGSKVLIALSLLLGASATFLLRGHLTRLEARAAAGGPRVGAVAATADLPRGAVLEQAMVVEIEVSPETLPPGALRDLGDALGRTLGADVLAGEVLTAARLAPPGGPIAALVPDGLRAVPVAAFLPPGIVVPGDRVDVLATFAEGGTEVVATGAEVLLVMGGTGDLGEATTLVLLVTPETARSLAVARAFGDLSVAIAPA